MLWLNQGKNSGGRSLVLGLILLWLTGCATLFPPKLKQPVLLDREPPVSFRYEFESAEISLPLAVEDSLPVLYRCWIAPRYNPSQPLFQQDFPPTDTLRIVLPSDVLDPDPFGNLLVLRPLGGDFETTELLFSMEYSPRLVLPEVTIRRRPLVLKGIIQDRRGEFPLDSIRVNLVDRSRAWRLDSTLTDSLGFYRFEVPARVVDASDLLLVIRPQRDYPGRTVIVPRDSSHLFVKDIMLGLSDQAGSRGPVYRVVRNQVPFRDNPESGARIQFFLHQGDLLVVTKSAGDRVYGFVELVGGTESQLQVLYGWVLTRDLERVDVHTQ